LNAPLAPSGAELSLERFLDEIASAEIMPGGGYVAAIALAMAAGLVAMAARLSHGNWPEARGAAAQAEALRFRGVSLAERNVRAYSEAVAVLGGKEDVEQGSQDHIIAEALERAADIPLRIAEAATDVSALAALVAERCDPAVRADVAVAALLSQAAARSGEALVAVNLGATKDDRRLVYARELAGNAQSALEKALDALS
jgi:glutamate formiminotransferase/formiminotetrahydrofolate cyclodeaminase